jgi:hypothetical protein
MALVKTGTFIATTQVKSPEIQFVPAAGTAIAAPSPFILTNVGRSNGANTDLIIVNNIAVEPADAHESTTNPASGSVASYICTVSGTAPMDNLLPIVPMDSTNGAVSGLSAHSGQIGWTDAGTLVSNIVMSPSPFSAAGATVAHLYGPYGATRISQMVPTDSLGIPTGSAFQIRKPDNGTTDSTIFVTVTLQTLAGKVYLVEGVSGAGSDIITIYNNTGSRILILDVRVVDAYRLTSVNQRYDVTISTANLRVDVPADIDAFDSSKPVPSWVQAGKGFYMREGADIWIDYTEVLDVQIPVLCNVYPSAAVPRLNRSFNTGRSTSKYLRPGKALVFTVPTASAMYQGEHDIIVTFTTYSEEVAVGGGGGEYSYAY